MAPLWEVHLRGSPRSDQVSSCSVLQLQILTAGLHVCACRKTEWLLLTEIHFKHFAASLNRGAWEHALSMTSCGARLSNPQQSGNTTWNDDAGRPALARVQEHWESHLAIVAVSRVVGDSLGEEALACRSEELVAADGDRAGSPGPGSKRVVRGSHHSAKHTGQNAPHGESLLGNASQLQYAAVPSNKWLQKGTSNLSSTSRTFGKPFVQLAAQGSQPCHAPSVTPICPGGLRAPWFCIVWQAEGTSRQSTRCHWGSHVRPCVLYIGSLGVRLGHAQVHRPLPPAPSLMAVARKKGSAVAPEM